MIKKDEKNLIIVPGVKVPVNVMKRIDKIVAKIPGMTRSQFCSNMLLLALQDAEFLDDLGVISLVEYIRASVGGIKKVVEGKTI